MDNTQNIISFCTGYGGLELGLRLAGVDVREVAYVEIEAFAAANLVAKMEEGKLVSAPVWTDLKTFPARLFRGKVHGILAGYPCQPFSTAGKRKGADDPRHLWPFIRYHIDTIRPIWCFFENVEGHLRLGFREVFADLRAMGYAVEAGLFTAAEVGVPHQRKRLFILGYSGCRARWEESEGWMDLEQNPLDKAEWKKSSNRLEQTSRILAKSQSRGSQGLSQSGEGLREPDAPGGELADTDSSGSGKDQQSAELWTKRTKQSSCDQGQYRQKKTAPRQEWPARPGQEQYEWEPPRTVEPGMGKFPDGYNPRVDQLRLLGNGVVPQQAAKAWIELWYESRPSPAGII